jgi:hypothetical protein
MVASAAIAGVVLGVVAGWFARGSQASQLGMQTQTPPSNTELQKAREQIEELELQLEMTTERYNELLPREETAVADEGEPSESTPGEASPDQPEDGRHFVYVESAAWVGGRALLTVDYAKMLTGKSAASAAKAAGDESPPPNDYYILNENPKTADLSAANSMTVRMKTDAEGSRPEGYDMSFRAWYDAFLTNPERIPGLKSAAYWIMVEEGTVVQMEEQFLP